MGSDRIIGMGDLVGLRVLIQNPFTECGGAEVRIRILIRELLGHSGIDAVHFLYAAGQAGHVIREADRLHHWPTPPARCANVTESIIGEFGIDLVQIHNDQEIGTEGARRAQQLGVPTIWVLHDFWPLCGMRFLTNVYLAEEVPRCEIVDLDRCRDCVGTVQTERTLRDRDVIERCEMGIVPTRIAQARLEANGLLVGRCEVVHPWTDLGLFSPDPNEPLDPDNVLFVSTFLPHKGIGVMLRAWRRIQQRKPRATLTAVGDAAHIAAVTRYASELGLRNVTFLPHMPQADLRRLYRRAAVTAFPTLWEETIGNVWVESLACATPVVVSSAGGIPELLGTSGILVEPGDDEQLASRILDVLSSPETSRRLALAGREHVTRKFNPTVALDRFMELYGKATLTGGSTAP